MLLLFAAWAGFGRRAEAERSIPFQLARPTDGWLLRGVMNLSRATKRPIGIELLPPLGAQRCLSGPKPPTLQKTDFRIGLDSMVVCAGRYRVIDNHGGSVEIRPFQEWIPQGSFLDQRIDFDIVEASVGEALERLHQQFDREYRGGPGDDGRRQPEDLKRRRTTLSVRGESVREILNRLCAGFGGTSWAVEYPGGTPVYSSSRITISSVNTPVWVVSLNARPSVAARERD